MTYMQKRCRFSIDQTVRFNFQHWKRIRTNVASSPYTYAMFIHPAPATAYKPHTASQIPHHTSSPYQEDPHRGPQSQRI